MTKHHDESMALAALFDCWMPKWRKVTVRGFTSDVRQALMAFGLGVTEESPCVIAREAKGYVLPAGDEHALLLTSRQLYSPGFLYAFRRFQPARVILAAKSGLWWAVWDKQYRPIAGTIFQISTAEYIPSKNRA